MKNRADLVWATLGEGGLVLALATIGWATNQPLIFASLGPKAYELAEQPQMPSARPYKVIVGCLLGGRGVSGALPVECLGGAKRARSERRLSTTPVGHGHI